jgi:hypothetical protein
VLVILVLTCKPSASMSASQDHEGCKLLSSAVFRPQEWEQTCSPSNSEE